MPRRPRIPRSVEPVLSVRGLEVTFGGSGRPVPAVRGIDFDVYPNEVLGIVGESGSGKSVTSLAVAGLLPETARVRGSIRLERHRGHRRRRRNPAAACEPRTSASSSRTRPRP